MQYSKQEKLKHLLFLASTLVIAIYIEKRRLEAVLQQLARSFRDDTVNLVLAHALVSGARFGTGERQLHLGEIFALRPESLPSNAHYAALGHLHRPQELAAAPCRAAYAGSPIELDFGEREQDKRVVLVEAKAGAPCELRSLPLSAGRRLLDVEGTLEELEARRDELGDAFLRVTVHVPEPQPGVEHRVRELLPDAVEVRQEWPRKEGRRPAAPQRPRDRRRRVRRPLPRPPRGAPRSARRPPVRCPHRAPASPGRCPPGPAAAPSSRRPSGLAREKGWP